VPQIRVVVFVAMVGIRLGDSGGDGTLKSRLQTTPNGQKLGSGAGHPGCAVVVVVVVGAVVVVCLWLLLFGVAGAAGAFPPVVVVCALDHGVVIPMTNVMAHKIVTPISRSGLG
jgi:hypothetical protein